MGTKPCFKKMFFFVFYLGELCRRFPVLSLWRGHLSLQTAMTPTHHKLSHSGVSEVGNQISDANLLPTIQAKLIL